MSQLFLQVSGSFCKLLFVLQMLVWCCTVEIYIYIHTHFFQVFLYFGGSDSFCCTSLSVFLKSDWNRPCVFRSIHGECYVSLYVILDIFLLLIEWHWKGSVPQAAVHICYKAGLSGQVLPLLIRPFRVFPGLSLGLFTFLCSQQWYNYWLALPRWCV